MKAYVAGKTHDLQYVRVIQGKLREHGIAVTHDWTEAVEEHGPDHDGKPLTYYGARRYADLDLRGVLSADLVIAVPNAKWCGTLIELGAAMSHDIPIVLVDTPHQRCIFWGRRNVYQLVDEPQALDRVLQRLADPDNRTDTAAITLWRLSDYTTAPVVLLDTVPIDGLATRERPQVVSA